MCHRPYMHLLWKLDFQILGFLKFPSSPSQSQLYHWLMRQFQWKPLKRWSTLLLLLQARGFQISGKHLLSKLDFLSSMWCPLSLECMCWFLPSLLGIRLEMEIFVPASLEEALTVWEGPWLSSETRVVPLQRLPMAQAKKTQWLPWAFLSSSVCCVQLFSWCLKNSHLLQPYPLLGWRWFTVSSGEGICILPPRSSLLSWTENAWLTTRYVCTSSTDSRFSFLYCCPKQP